nr:Phytopthora agathidicda GPCR-TKL 3 [Phytophthora agathidicida]
MTILAASIDESEDSQWFIDKFEIVQILVLVEYLFMFGMCLALVLYLRRNRHIARTGNSSASRKVLLPAFAPLLWLLGCTIGVYSIVMLFFVSFQCFRGKYSDVLLEIFYSMRLFVFGLIIVFLLQKSVSIPALRRSVVITLTMALYTIPVDILLTAYVEPNSPHLSFAVMSAMRSPVLLFFVYVFVRPPARASKQTMREYCFFVFTYSALFLSSECFFHLGASSVGFILTYATMLWAIMCPAVIWRILKADTEFWRGLGRRAVDLQTLFRQQHSIDDRISSQGLHVLIEMHRKLIIDFTQLKFEKKIGTGSSAVVISGLLDAVTPVAVKVYTPVLFSEETVAEFSQEAALCGALKHPNVVKFYGMCIYPPTICLVSELCQGTLGDVTCAARTRFANSALRFHERQQMLLNVCYMMDAARAVAYLHSFSPPFLHRDIKPDNFVVDVHGAVKLTDFGESRSLARSHKTEFVASLRDDVSPDIFSDYAEFASSPVEATEIQSMMSSFPKLSKLTVKGTVDYMAPEIINGKSGFAVYGEAADVYSLAMTMWDILHPGTEKFPDLKNNHLQVFASVVEGKRPELELDASDGQLHSSLRGIIEAAWQPDPESRPSAQAIVHALEGVQEELLAVFATELLPELANDISSSVCKTHQGTADVFSGELIVARLQDMKFVHSPCEAVRLGSAFMDAGLLHHKKHAYGFENTLLKYFFDEANIRLCQPLEKVSLSSVAIDVRNKNSYLDDDLERQQERFGLPSSTPPLRQCSGNEFSEDECSVQNNPTGSRPFYASEILQGSSANGASVRGGDGCRCRKLGQRLETARSTHGQRLRWKFKPAVADENVLTTRLLEADDAAVTPKGLAFDNAMDGFDFVGVNVRAA